MMKGQRITGRVVESERRRRRRKLRKEDTKDENERAERVESLVTIPHRSVHT